MKEEIEVTTEKMLDALSRSGYLLEAEVAKQLSKLNFFVQTNLVVEDPVSKKSREIDVVANSNDWANRRSTFRACAKITFVFEVKKNLYPIVLLNDFEPTPYIEPMNGLKEMITKPSQLVVNYEAYHEGLIESRNSPVFSQYCSFQPKKQKEFKGELMALHPENIYSGISKIIQYCQERENSTKEQPEDKFYRRFLFLPVLLVKDDLYEMREGELEKVDSSVLVVNYIHESYEEMAYVFVVTRNGLDDFVGNALKIQERVRLSMLADLESK